MGGSDGISGSLMFFENEAFQAILCYAAYIGGLVLTFFFGLLVYAIEHYSSSKYEVLIEKLGEKAKRKAQYFDNNWLDLLSVAAFLKLASIAFLFVLLVLGKPSFESLPSMGLFLLLLVALMYVFSYEAPKHAAKLGEEEIFLKYAQFLTLLMFPLYPVVLFRKGIEWFTGKLTGRKAESPDRITEEEILDIVSDGEHEGVIEEQELEMIENIFKFDDLPASEVMTQRTAITTINADASLEEAAKLAVLAGHSRIPVSDGDKDNIVGILYVKDLLKYWKDKESVSIAVKRIMRDAYYVPETKPISRLFSDFKQQHIHFAVVLDEYGGTAGVITIEDIIEEIVGEIEDEYDKDSSLIITSAPDGSFVINAKTPIEEINSRLEYRLPESDSYDTIGGLVLEVLGHIPVGGENITVGDYEMTVLEADARSIKKLSLKFVERIGENGEEREVDGD